MKYVLIPFSEIFLDILTHKLEEDVYIRVHYNSYFFNY